MVESRNGEPKGEDRGPVRMLPVICELDPLFPGFTVLGTSTEVNWKINCQYIFDKFSFFLFVLSVWEFYYSIVETARLISTT